MPENNEISEEKKQEIEAKVARLRELANLPNKTNEQLMEFCALETEIENFRAPYLENVHEFLKKEAFKSAGMTPRTEEERKAETDKVAQQYEDSMSEKLAKQKKIREGITNTEAEEYVRGLVKENNRMARELVLAKFENQALKANNEELIKKIEKESQDMKNYLSSVQNVFSMFGEKIKNVSALHKVVEETNDPGSSSKS